MLHFYLTSVAVSYTPDYTDTAAGASKNKYSPFTVLVWLAFIHLAYRFKMPRVLGLLVAS